MVLHNVLRSQYQGQHGGHQPGDDDDDDMPGDGRLIGGAADCGRDRNPTKEAKKTEGLPQGLLQYGGNSGLARWQNITATALTSLFQV